jgi:tetratricopeptide (TPR) repeat protein
MAKLSTRFGLSRYEADEYYRIAIDFYRKNNLSDAIQNMNYALMLLPTHAEYLAARGFFYLEDGVLDKAEEDSDSALRRNSFEQLANYTKGVVAYKRENWQMAHDYFMKAWAADSSRPETQYYIALVLHRKGEYKQAHTWMKQAQVLWEKQNDKLHLRDVERWLIEIERWM